MGTLHLTKQEDKAVIVISLSVTGNGFSSHLFNLVDALIAKSQKKD